MKTSIRIMNYESTVTKSNPELIKLFLKVYVAVDEILKILKSLSELVLLMI